MALKWACDKFPDPSIPEKQKLGYLRCIGEFNRQYMELAIAGPGVMCTEEFRKKVERAGVNLDLNLNNNLNDNSSSSRYNVDRDKYDSGHTIN